MMDTIWLDRVAKVKMVALKQNKLILHKFETTPHVQLVYRLDLFIRI